MPFETCPLLDELPWIRHGFFDRDHGVANTRIDVQKFSEDFPRTLFLPQNHGNYIITANDPLPEGVDAAITTEDNLALAVKTADCAPVLLVCTETKMIAAVHAGWPGALNQITCKTVKEMQARGADPAAMIAAVGPCLQADSFPVQADVYNKFMGQLPEAMDYLAAFEDRWKLDLVGIVYHQLKKSGVKTIWSSPSNTLTNPDYYSWRGRAHDPDSETMRNVSILMKINL